MNLFERLYRYREKEGKHERENYLTELLASVMETNSSLCHRLCEYASISAPAGTKFRVRTQVSYAEGQPDIVIESAAHDILLLIECKLEAGQGNKQLERYQRIVAASTAPLKGIIFLTKYYESPGDPLIYCLRWYQLFSFLSHLPSGEIITLFKEFLAFHQLHKPMNFLPADLVALEQIQSTIAKMDEVLSPIEWQFRKYLGGTGQYTKSRAPKLAEGWYGYWRYIGTSLFRVGFEFESGSMPWCLIVAESWNCAEEPISSGPNANKVQQALREKWGIPEAKLSYLAVTSPVASFSSNQDDSVVAMRKWFQYYFEQMNAVLEKHEYFWKGVPEVVVDPDDEQEILSAPPLTGSMLESSDSDSQLPSSISSS